MKNRIGRYSLRLAAIFGIALVSLPAFASWEGIAESVHFYSASYVYDKKVDFGRVPQARMLPGYNNETERAGGSYGYESGENEEDSERTAKQRYDRIRARNFEAKGDFRRALRAYGDSETPDAFDQDRKELFERLNYKSVPGLDTYLTTTYLLVYGGLSQQVDAIRKLRKTTVDQRLVPHVAYVLTGIKNPYVGPTQARAYWSVYKLAPRHPRAESALIMAIRGMLSERSTKDDKPTPSEIVEARGWIATLLSKFPDSRFRYDAIGWQGRCEWLNHEPAKALECYLQQAKLAEDGYQRWHAYESIIRICNETGRTDRALVWLLRERAEDIGLRTYNNTIYQLADRFESLSSTAAKRFQKAIRQDPALLESYLAFRIEDTALSPKQEQNLLTFATLALDRMPRVPGHLLSRVAQLNYNAGRYRSAEAMAQRAMSSSTASKEDRQRAQYAYAASQLRLGRPKAAISEYRALVAQKPPLYIRQSAQENLALLEERNGDPVKAMEIYRQLDYSDDIAYLADARLTPEQLQRYIAGMGTRSSWSPPYASEGWNERHLTAKDNRNILTYTLAMRYLRQDRYAEARQTLLRLPRQTRLYRGLTAKQWKELTADGSIGYESVPALEDPLQVVDKLDRVTKRSKTGSTEHRAQALYDKAAYIYHKRNLLFYSPGIWFGYRASTIDLFWSKSVNNQADENALDRHFHEHECLAQSLRICDELVAKYPKSKLVPKALYTAAVSADHLANLNAWWRDRGDHLLKLAINRVNRLVDNYPNDPLAKTGKKYAGVFKEELAQPRY